MVRISGGRGSEPSLCGPSYENPSHMCVLEIQTKGGKPSSVTSVLWKQGREQRCPCACWNFPGPVLPMTSAMRKDQHFHFNNPTLFPMLPFCFCNLRPMGTQRAFLFPKSILLFRALSVIRAPPFSFSNFRQVGL